MTHRTCLFFLTVFGLFAGSTSFASHAEAQSVAGAITISGEMIYERELRDLKERVDQLRARFTTAPESQMEALAAEMSDAARTLADAKRKARRAKPTTVVFHGPSGSPTNISNVVKRLSAQPKLQGGTFHVYLTPQGAPKISRQSPIGRVKHRGATEDQPRTTEPRRRQPEATSRPSPPQRGLLPPGPVQSRPSENLEIFGQPGAPVRRER